MANKRLFKTPKQVERLARTYVANDNHIAKTARALGVHPNTVTRMRTREEVQQAIRIESEKLLSLVPDVTELFTKVIAEGNALVGRDRLGDEKARANDIKMIGEAVRAGERVGMATGLLPSHTPAYTMNSVIFADSHSLSPILASLLALAVPSTVVEIAPGTGYTPATPVEG